jgi:surface antigen
MAISAKIASLFLLLLIGSWSAEVFADPPKHAPAHGWRKKHDPYYVGYSGKHWEHDYDIQSGRCNREAIATVLGSVAGAVIGNRTSEPENRTVATIVGAVAGALVGKWIGRRLDDADRGCVGHALEVGKSGQSVAWTNDTTGVRYEMVPGSDRQRNGSTCRNFALKASSGSEKTSRQGIACQSNPGVWEIME